jgi:hypothetical protein
MPREEWFFELFARHAQVTLTGAEALRALLLHPVQRFYAEAGGAATLFLATCFGIPVSTTHTIIGAIVDVGAARKAAAVRWNIASNVVTAWILTMPAAALLGRHFMTPASCCSDRRTDCGGTTFVGSSCCPRSGTSQSV